MVVETLHVCCLTDAPETDWDTDQMLASKCTSTAIWPGHIFRKLICASSSFEVPMDHQTCLFAHIHVATTFARGSPCVTPKNLAMCLQAYLNKIWIASIDGNSQAPAKAPSISAVMFGSPNVGDAAFAAYFDRTINARNVQYKYDSIFQVPCPMITGCTHRLVPVATYAGSLHGAWSYARVGGQVDLDLGDIPVQRDAWSRMTVLTQQDFCRTSETVLWNVDAAHYCSYFCTLGAYAGQLNWCKLWPEAEGSAGHGASYCFQGVPGAQYPKVPAFPFH